MVSFSSNLSGRRYSFCSTTVLKISSSQVFSRNFQSAGTACTVAFIEPQHSLHLKYRHIPKLTVTRRLVIEHNLYAKLTTHALFKPPHNLLVVWFMTNQSNFLLVI